MSKSKPSPGTTYRVDKTHEGLGGHEWVRFRGEVTHDESLERGPVVMTVPWVCHCGAWKDVEYLVEKGR